MGLLQPTLEFHGADMPAVFIALVYAVDPRFTAMRLAEFPL